MIADSDRPKAPIGVTVYRSYSTAVDGAGPTESLVSVAADCRDDDGVFVNGTARGLDVNGDGTPTAADSVPDIKIYRRSAVLYDDDEDDDELDGGTRISANRSIGR